MPRGGKRPGSGRPKEPGTKMVRVPVELVQLVNDLKQFRLDHKNNPRFYNNVMSELSEKISNPDFSMIDLL